MPKLNNEYICVCIHSYIIVCIYIKYYFCVCDLYTLCESKHCLSGFMHPSSISSITLYMSIYLVQHLEIGYYNFRLQQRWGSLFPRDATVDIMQLMIWGLNGLLTSLLLLHFLTHLLYPRIHLSRPKLSRSLRNVPVAIAILQNTAIVRQ